MFGKTFKKAVSILVTAIFILSLVPTVGMAETDSTKFVQITNAGYVRVKNGRQESGGAFTKLQIRGNEGAANNHYVGIAQLDLSDYVEIIENTDTELTLTVVGASGSDSTDPNEDRFKVIAYGYKEYVTDDTFTYANMEPLGLTDSTNGTEICRHDETGNRETDSVTLKIDDKSIIKEILDNQESKIITLSFMAVNGDRSYAAISGTGLNVNYKKDDINNKEYTDKIAEKITWNMVSDETKEENGRHIIEGTSLKALPTKFHGATVSWSATPEGIINTETSEITTPSQKTDVTLTATITYQGADNTVELGTSTKSFDITIPVFDPQEYVDGLAESFSWADVSEDQSIDAVTTNFALPSTHEDASVEWEISVSNAATLSGSTVVVTPKYTKEKATLTATLKFTYNEIVYESSKSFGVTIPEIPVGNDGSTLLQMAGGSGTSYHSQVNESEGIGGKKSDDRYIKYTDALDNPYLQLGGGAVLEASVLMTDECDDAGSYIESTIYLDDAKEETHYLSFVFEKDGIYITTSEESTKVSEMPMNEWINFVAVAPTGLNSDTGEYDHTWELYINGKCVYIGTIQSTTNIGFRYNRFRGRDPKIEIAEGESHDPSNYKTSIYIDNVSLIPVGNTYDPSIYNEAPLTMTVYDADKEGKIITLENAITVKALKDDIVTDEFTSVRVYDGEDNLLNDDTTLYDGCRVVLATTNQTSIERTYSYYEVRIADGKLLFNVPVLEVDAEGKVTTSITAHNYTGEDAQYKVYLAKYTDSTLTSVSPLTFTAEKGKATTDTSLTATLEKGETAKLFIWSGVENDYTPITVAKSVTK